MTASYKNQRASYMSAARITTQEINHTRPGKSHVSTRLGAAFSDRQMCSSHAIAAAAPGFRDHAS
jgi:hypothetical protein